MTTIFIYFIINLIVCHDSFHMSNAITRGCSLEVWETSLGMIIHTLIIFVCCCLRFTESASYRQSYSIQFRTYLYLYTSYLIIQKHIHINGSLFNSCNTQSMGYERIVTSHWSTCLGNRRNSSRIYESSWSWWRIEYEGVFSFV
jgi:hypothetical protein